MSLANNPMYRILGISACGIPSSLLGGSLPVTWPLRQPPDPATPCGMGHSEVFEMTVFRLYLPDALDPINVISLEHSEQKFDIHSYFVV